MTTTIEDLRMFRLYLRKKYRDSIPGVTECQLALIAAGGDYELAEESLRIRRASV